MDSCCDFKYFVQSITNCFYTNVYSFNNEEYNEYEMKKKDLVEPPKHYYMQNDAEIKKEDEEEWVITSTD